MTDDIVTRLRELADCWEMREAADEIERLRKHVSKLEAMLILNAAISPNPRYNASLHPEARRNV